MERSSSDGVSVEVPSQYCDPVEKPIEEDTCHLFCSNECVLSEWSPWTSCKHVVSTKITNEIEFILLLSFQSKNCFKLRFLSYFQCLSNKRRNVIPDSHVSNKQKGQVIYDTMTTKEKFQMRNRTILRRPNGSQNGKDENRCRVHDPEAYMQNTKYERVTPLSSYLTENHYENLMPLQERRSCFESRDCQARSQYKWSLTGWSSCLPTNVNADSSCGEGVRR